MNEEKWRDTLMEIRQGKKTKPLLITLIVGECTAGFCTSFTKDLMVASNKLKKHHASIVDCADEPDLCRLIPQGESKYSLVTVLIADGRTYEYKGAYT